MSSSSEVFPIRATIVLAVLALTAAAADARGERGSGGGPQSQWQISGDTIDVIDTHGGSVRQYDSLWADLAAQGKKVRVVGPCQSACTVLLGHIPRDRICVTAAASFGFHTARIPAMTHVMWSGYSNEIKGWIDERGGLTSRFIWMSAPDTYRFFRRCP